MKELSIEEKAKAYDEALKQIKECTPDENGFITIYPQEIFPELKESEGERMIQYFKDLAPFDKADELYNKYGFTHKDAIAWLKKKGRHKPVKSLIDSWKEMRLEVWAQASGNRSHNVSTDNTKMFSLNDIDEILEKIGDCQIEHKPEESKPKFNVGDWIIHETSNFIYKVLSRGNDGYMVANVYNDKFTISLENEERYHLWTIQDANNGDVLSYVTDKGDLWIMIYWSLYESYEGHVHYHTLLVNDNFGDKGTCCICIDNLKPATKEQRDLLFQKMHEAGYKWDANKKELKIIGQKPADITDKLKEEYQKGWDAAMQQLPKEVDSQIWQIANNSAIKWEESFAILCASQKAYNKGKKDALKKQKPTEWSEEDKQMLDNIEWALIDKQVKEQTPDKFKQELNWLKSLKDRYTWKPSDEQMRVLDLAIKCGINRGTKEETTLVSLFNDLKKLRER